MSQQTTSYQLAVQGIKSKSELNNVTRALKSLDIINYALLEAAYLPYNNTQVYYSYEPTSWIRHEDDMQTLSKRFPNLTFKLRCLGETLTGTYEYYIRDGKSEKCHMVFSPPQTIVWE